MTREEMFRKNQQLSTEFELYLLDHPEIEEKIPDNAMIVLLNMIKNSQRKILNSLKLIKRRDNK